jgi:hypothetical protein
MAADVPGMRRMWTGIAVAGAVFSVGDFDQLRLIMRGPITLGISLGATFQAICAAIGAATIVAAMLAVPTGLRTRGDRVRFGLDLTIVMAGTIGICAFAYMPSPSEEDAGVLELATGPGVFILGTFAVVRLILSVEPPFTTGRESRREARRQSRP